MNDSITVINPEYFLLQIYNFVTGEGAEGALSDTFAVFWFNFKIVAWSISLLLFIGIVYSLVRIHQIRVEERAVLNAPKTALLTTEERKNEKWQRILDLAVSENPGDWRLAILEADIVLDELITRMEYKGENLGEKLRSIESSDFNTLEQAWEAHKVRNTIAHTGSDFILTQREARRIIDLYKQVFEEFHFI